MAPLVSVLIPCFNAEPFVTDAVCSALSQSHQPLEVICVDDGSTDATVEVLRRFGDRIKLIEGKHRGACAARNQALSASRGEYIQFLDADDMLLPDKIARQLPPLLEGTADMVISSGHLLSEQGQLLPPQYALPDPAGVDPLVYTVAYANRGLTTEGVLHRRSLLEAIRGFQEHLTRYQDCDLHIRLGAHGARIHKVTGLLYKHRDHSGPRITSFRDKWDDFLQVILDLVETLESGEAYTMNETRRSALAAKIYTEARQVYRKSRGSSSRQAAVAAFARARALSADCMFSQPLWYRSAARALGPAYTEMLYKAALRIRQAGSRVSRRLQPKV